MTGPALVNRAKRDAIRDMLVCGVTVRQLIACGFRKALILAVIGGRGCARRGRF